MMMMMMMMMMITPRNSSARNNVIRDSSNGIETRLLAAGLTYTGFEYRQGEKCSASPDRPDGLWPYHTSVHWIPRPFTLEIKRPG